jgi:hypothetical protein
VIDIAMLTFGQEHSVWQLQRKDHASARWINHSSHATLQKALAVLVEDAGRIFWQ